MTLKDIEFKETITVAIVGDPHFYREHDGSKNGVSHITLNANGEFCNRDAGQNPWAGLNLLVENGSIKADILVCAGDITYGGDKVALEKAWNELLLLARKLEVRFMVSATGNHDVSSRSNAEKIAKNPAREMSAVYGLFEPLKLLTPSYPVVEFQDGQFADHRLTRTKYFGDAIVMVEAESFRLIVLNSCCEHGADSYQYERGTFPKSAQEALALALTEATERKINILVCHHPPESHAEHDLGAYDFIENGDALLKSLEQHGAWFIVHGHKHHGRIEYAKGSSSSPIVFSAASLGIQVDSAADGMRNQFYCAKISRKKIGTLFGTVSAWDWNLGMGWHKATPISGGIYDGCGFGSREALEGIAEEISSHIPGTWGEITQKVPSLKYITPGEMAILERRLRENSPSIVVEPDANGYWSELRRGLV